MQRYPVAVLCILGATWLRFTRMRTRRNKFLVGILMLAAASPHPAAAAIPFTDEAAFLAAARSATLIDFDLLSNGEAIVAQFSSDGVTFEGFNGGDSAVLELSIPTFCMDNHSEPLSFDTVPAFQGGGGFLMRFSPRATAVGLWIGDLETVSGTTTLTLLDADEQIIDSFTLVAHLGDAPCEWKFFGVTSDELIHAVSISISPFDYVLFDDLYFEPPPPVPALSLIAGVVLAGLLGGTAARMIRLRRR